LLGIEESSDSPKRAVSVKPVRDCHELAKRLSQAAYACIEPPLSELQVAGVPVGDQSGAGVVVFRVRQSHNAPHRLIKDRHCYYRRGESTVALSMREIQDLTLNATRWLQRVEERLSGFREEFHSKANVHNVSITQRWVSYRVTSVPLTPLRLRPDDVRAKLLNRRAQFEVRYGRGQPREIFVAAMDFNNKPVLRGTMIYNQTGPVSFEHSAYLDGAQTLTSVAVYEMNILARDVRNEGAQGISLNHILGAVASVLCISQEFAALSSMPAAEFAVELEITSTVGATYLNPMAGTFPAWRFDKECLLLPQYSYIPEFGLSEILNLIQGDLLNCAGQPHGDILQSVRVIS
jgi:hypothetical protein